MKTVILCGGMGTRLSEETTLKPKPMVEIGGRPILWHIMKIYAHHGFQEFVLALGYKGEIIKDYFINYHPHTSDVTVNLANGQLTFANSTAEDWLVHLMDTGRTSMTGGRLHRLERLLKPDGTFMLTYGDGVADLDIKALVEFHRHHGRLATITGVRPAARFGGIRCNGEQVLEFKEKPQAGEGWINGGFMVMEPGFFDYLHGDATVLEEDPLENLARDGQLMVYRHYGFWHCMDTLRDRNVLDNLWREGQAPWKVWGPQ
jgi:glucose-1-phosphate cytidylyltransferase